MKRPATPNHGPKSGMRPAKDPRPPRGTLAAVRRVMKRGVKRKNVLDEE